MTRLPSSFLCLAANVSPALTGVPPEVGDLATVLRETFTVWVPRRVDATQHPQVYIRQSPHLLHVLLSAVTLSRTRLRLAQGAPASRSATPSATFLPAIAGRDDLAVVAGGEEPKPFGGLDLVIKRAVVAASSNHVVEVEHQSGRWAPF